MAKRRTRRKQKTVARKLLAALLPLLVAALAGYGVWEYSPNLSLPAAAMPEGSLVAVQVIDVGQGSSLLLHTGEHSVLIDAGEAQAYPAVSAQLGAWGIESLDLLVLTHPHTDHYGGMTDLLGDYEVETLWMPEIDESLLPTSASYEALLDAIEQNGCEVELKNKPDSLSLGEGVTLTLLDGFAADPDNLNDTSLCLRIDAGEASFLATGDGESAVEKQLLESHAPVDVDLLVAGHHGSSSSSRQELLDAATPKGSAISCGAGNSYGHPNAGTLERLAPFGPIYRTDLMGTITFTTDGETIAVTAQGISDTIDAKG